MTVIYTSGAQAGAEWLRLFTEKAPDIPLRIWPDVEDPEDVRFMISWIPPEGIFEEFPNLEVLFSIGAGVDQLRLDKVPPHILVVRMVEPGLISGMIDYVSMAVLAAHRDLVHYVAQQKRKNWSPRKVVLTGKRRVGILGLGVLGQACCNRLSALGFKVSGWNRSPRTIEGVQCFAGTEQLDAFFSESEILICLLPLTPATHGVLNAELFAKLPAGAALISVGRGGHLHQEDLLTALDSGQISCAILDVTTPEPLPADHPLWERPDVLITPHIASKPQLDTAVDAVLENIRRHETKEQMTGLVNRNSGY